MKFSNDCVDCDRIYVTIEVGASCMNDWVEADCLDLTLDGTCKGDSVITLGTLGNLYINDGGTYLIC